MTDWRLGIDLGTHSLGWAALRVEKDADGRWRPVGILDAGSRIFGTSGGAGRDSKSGESLAVARRDARAMRRRRDRFLQRQRALMKHLIADGLFPADEDARKALETLDPFALRARALDEALPLHHVGRAVWHLNQRRGFKSNRKTDKAEPGDETGKIRLGTARLERLMDDVDARTFGEWLHIRRQATSDHPDGLPVRTRLRPKNEEDGEAAGYDFYPDRRCLEEEFAAIMSAQAEFHPDELTPQVRERLYEIVFHQRPLKTPKIGTCTSGNGEQRLPKAHPLFQRRRLLEEVNALKIVQTGQRAERLTPQQRDALLSKLKDRGTVTYESLRKALKLDPDARFNKESENRPDMKGDEVAAQMCHKTRFGARWLSLPVDAQWALVERLEGAESDDDIAAFRSWVGENYGVDEAHAATVSSARLPQGHGRFGETVTRGLIDALEHERDPDDRVIVYSEAMAAIGLHHSDRRTGELLDTLPPYPALLENSLIPGSGDESEPDIFKRVGRLTNPTVHIGLNQLRRLVNALIERYGKPRQIAIELARDLKLTDKEKDRRNKENRDNRLAAQRRSMKLTGEDADGNMIGESIARDSGANRALLKLWEELDQQDVLNRRCVYTGTLISIGMLFDGSVEVDHILPFAATLDDSAANKLLCLRSANREKRRRSPYQAWGHTDQWPDIAARAARLPKAKRWRFEPDAMDRHRDDGGFLARQLVDTQYLSRLARGYLGALYADKDEGAVWASPGRLTELVRRKLGLNKLLGDDNIAGDTDTPKNRLDHRHHAIDAIVIAATDLALLNRIARASGTDGHEGREKIEIPHPWGASRDAFRQEVEDAVRRIVVSHRPDHGTAGHGGTSTAGRLHNETAYGLTGEVDARGNALVVRRKPIVGLKPADLAAIRDPDLRTALYRATEHLTGKAFDRAVHLFGKTGPLQFRGVRRVRMTEPLKVIPILDREGHAYKGYKGDSNYRYDVWELADGKWVTNWRDRDGMPRSSVISMFDAHRPNNPPRPHPTARRILSLHQDDILAIEPNGGERQLMRVVKFGQNGQVTLAPPKEGGDLKRRDETSNEVDPFKYVSPTAGGLRKLRARKVQVDETGRVRDPGFGARTARRATRPRAAAAE